MSGPVHALDLMEPPQFIAADGKMRFRAVSVPKFRLRVNASRFGASVYQRGFSVLSLAEHHAFADAF